jgi:hypothetical protein
MTGGGLPRLRRARLRYAIDEFGTHPPAGQSHSLP